jgi:hypothetical protein
VVFTGMDEKKARIQAYEVYQIVFEEQVEGSK